MQDLTRHGSGAIPQPPLSVVERFRILERVDSVPEGTLVVITAPAGYGKTTLMRQIAAHSERSAYVRIRETHQDPTVLMHHIAVALSDIEELPDDLLARVSAPSLEPGLQAASRLAEIVGRVERPGLLLLDDIHVLRERRAMDALAMFIELLPAGLRLVAAGHDASALRPARLRAERRLIDIDQRELSFDADETVALARLLGLELSPDELDAVSAESEGWPVAVSLAMLSLAAAGDQRATRPDAVVKRSVADYIRAELLEPLDLDRCAWLLRSSVLETMSGALCDHALETSGSLARLREFERSSMLVQPVDDEATHYRYHPLLRSLLREELDVSLPGEAPVIAARAADWFHRQGQSLDALEYARLSGDRDLTARLVAIHTWPLHWSGRIATLESWVEWFDHEGLRDRYVSVAVIAGFIYVIDGRRHAGELWLAAAERSDDAGPMPEGSSSSAWIAMLRGMTVINGIEAMAADARIAEEGMRGDSPFMPGVRLLSAAAAMLAGDHVAAATRARDAVELAEARGALPGFAMATGIEATLLFRAGREQLARKRVEYALDKLRAAGLVDYVLCGLLHAVAARSWAAPGSRDRARHHLGHVHRLRPMMTAAAPWLSVPARLEAIEALVSLSDTAAARTLMREVDEILVERPDLGTLVADAEAMRSRLARIAEAGVGHWTLTTAELRVLQYLPTHLTFAEIAERLYVSPHTVKSQAVAIYSKLGVSSRRAAIEAAVEYGLLDGSALRFPLGPGVDTGIG